MLHLDTSRRLSIDVDIVCPPGLDIREYIGKYGSEYGFLEATEIDRNSRTGVPKSHAEYRYAVTYPSGRPTDKILLDVLYEDIKYNEVVSLAIKSPLLKQEGEPMMVQCPGLKDMLGDKLTAFAPHTIRQACANDLMTLTPLHLAFTEKGFFIQNDVLSDMLLEHEEN